MKDKHFYDITEVCNMLKTTSRTLRFYEEKGIIQSTTSYPYLRRRYTQEQLSQIKNVFVLRSLGLSVNSIADLTKSNSDLKDAIISRRAEIYALLETKNQEINLLNEAISAIESGKNIFEQEWSNTPSAGKEEKQIAQICSNAIVMAQIETLYKYLSPRMVQYMPRDVYMVVREDTLSPIGEFVSFDGISVDKTYPNKIYQFVKYSKLGLKITFVFHDKKIEGLWLGYYNTK